LTRFLPPFAWAPRTRGAVAEVRRVVFPAIPCARFLCAPSDAGRVNVLPQTSQTRAPAAARVEEVLAVSFLLRVVLRFFAVVFADDFGTRVVDRALGMTGLLDCRGMKTLVRWRGAVVPKA
jgi:hypothetical protein